MTTKSRILEYLASFGPATDAKLAATLGVRHQAVNQACRQLEYDGCLRRLTGDGAIQNVLMRRHDAKSPAGPTLSEAYAWYWEGNVQSRIVAYLRSQGWSIERRADTASKERGKDIVAVLGHRRLWVSVKGYPRGTQRTNPSTQARHWFCHGVFDLLVYRTESATAELALGLPLVRATYRKLLERARWAFASLPARVFWVNDAGLVSEQRVEP